MELTVIEKPAFSVVGAAAAGEPGKLNYGQIWEQQYMPVDAALKPYSIDGGYYGVTLVEDNQYIYLAGMAVAGLPALPPGTVQRDIKAGSYAVFTCGMDAVGSTWRAAYQEWLPASEYAVIDGNDFEYYPPPGPDGVQQVEIYIPVRKKEPASAG